MIKKFDFICLGGGIGVLAFLSEWIKAHPLSVQHLSVVLISAHDYFPPCSYNTTATVSRDGIEAGVSPLGDLLVKSYDYFSKEYGHNIRFENSIEKTMKLTVGDQNAEISSRESFLISPEKFHQTLLETIQASIPKLTIIHEPVKAIIFKSEKIFQLSLGGQGANEKIFESTCLFDGRGYAQVNHTEYLYQNFPISFYEAWKKLQLKTVAGSFWSKRVSSDFQFSLPESTFVVNKKCSSSSTSSSISDTHIFWRKNDRTVIIGNTTDQSHLHLPSVKKLQTIFQQHKGNHQLPWEFHEGTLKTGIRTKGKQRRPVLAEIPLPSNELGHSPVKFFLISGLYKNGYSTSFYLAKKFFNETETFPVEYNTIV